MELLYDIFITAGIIFGVAVVAAIIATILFDKMVDDKTKRF